MNKIAIENLLDMLVYNVGAPTSTNIPKESIIDKIEKSEQSEEDFDQSYLMLQVVNQQFWQVTCVPPRRTLYYIKSFSTFKDLNTFILHNVKPCDAESVAIYAQGDYLTISYSGFDLIYSAPIYRVERKGQTEAEGKVISFECNTMCDAQSTVCRLLSLGFEGVRIKSLYDGTYLGYKAFKSVGVDEGEAPHITHRESEGNGNFGTSIGEINLYLTS